MRLFPTLLLLTLSSAAAAQSSAPPATTLKDDEPIIVRGVADGARVVEVDFDRVWKSCAECKRALKKLNRLAQSVRDEQANVVTSTNRPATSSEIAPITGAATFSRSSAQEVGQWDNQVRRGLSDGQASTHGEISAQQSANYGAELTRRFVQPELNNLAALTQSFLDQLAPHVAEATEAERVAKGASAGISDRKRSKVTAKDIKRIDVTDAVIRRLDAMQFTIDLPEPGKSPTRRN